MFCVAFCVGLEGLYTSLKSEKALIYLTVVLRSSCLHKQQLEEP